MTSAVWSPVSACGAHCLLDGTPAETGLARRVARLAGLVAVLVGAAAMAPLLPVLPRRWRAAAVRSCARLVLRALGIRWRLRGRLPGRRALVVANHVSWLDVLVLLSAGGTRLVAKSEVRGWPVVGWIAAGTGAFFLDRARPRALLSTVDGVRAALASGGVVAVFPEGTTSCGEGAGGFRPAFFQAALDASACVVPVTLRFTVDGTPTTQPAFIGADTLVDSVSRVLALRRLTVSVAAGTPIHAEPGTSRRTLAKIAATAVGS